MKKEAICIMLVDDNKYDNFFHEREIKKIDLETEIIVKKSGIEALEYLNSLTDSGNTKPDLIFLDINMPGMNGWEFLDEYSKLERDIQCGIVIIMLTTSDDPESIARAMSWSCVADYMVKPLIRENIKEIYHKYFC